VNRERERKDRNNRDKERSRKTLCSQQTALTVGTPPSKQASPRTADRKKSFSYINTIRDCRNLDQSNHDIAGSCNWFKQKKGVVMWKRTSPVTSHHIFVYPLHISVAKIPNAGYVTRWAVQWLPIAIIVTEIALC